MANGDSTWGSLARSLIPAGIGFLLGGPVGAAGTLAAGGERRKEEEERRLREAQGQREQQRIEMERERLRLAQNQETRLQTRFEAENKILDFSIQKLDQEMKDDVAFRAGLSPEELRRYQELGRDKYREFRQDRLRIESAGRVLPTVDKRFTEESARDFAIALGNGKNLGDFINEERRQQRESLRDRYYTAISGDLLISYDRQTGKLDTKPLTDDPRIKIQERVNVRKQLLQAYEKSPDSFMLNFDDWINTPTAKLEEGMLLGQVSPEDYQRTRETIRRQDAEDQKVAAYVLYQDWQKKQGWMASKDWVTFMRYLQTPDGANELRSYSLIQRGRGNQWNLPAKQPSFTDDVRTLWEWWRSPSEAESPLAKPGVTAELTKPADAQALPKTYEEWKRMREGKKRRSLDEIAREAFGGPLGPTESRKPPK
ncbi:MAG: hypothetical protein HY694_00905 [Deltaproteobacteria bacterium]|nr:hypothetical protein [Deltaproteobacteria bacterium]